MDYRNEFGNETLHSKTFASGGKACVAETLLKIKVLWSA